MMRNVISTKPSLCRIKNPDAVVYYNAQKLTTSARSASGRHFFITHPGSRMSIAMLSEARQLVNWVRGTNPTRAPGRIMQAISCLRSIAPSARTIHPARQLHPPHQILARQGRCAAPGSNKNVVCLLKPQNPTGFLGWAGFPWCPWQPHSCHRSLQGRRAEALPQY